MRRRLIFPCITAIALSALAFSASMRTRFSVAILREPTGRKRVETELSVEHQYERLKAVATGATPLAGQQGGRAPFQ